MVAGKNFGEFGKSGAIRQSFTHSNLYHKTAGVNSAKNEHQVNRGNMHAWLKLVATKSTLDSVQSPLQSDCCSLCQ